MRITSIRMASLYWSPATKRAMGQSTNPGSEHQSREECLHILHSVCNESFIKKNGKTLWVGDIAAKEKRAGLFNHIPIKMYKPEEMRETATFYIRWNIEADLEVPAWVNFWGMSKNVLIRVLKWRLGSQERVLIEQSLEEICKKKVSLWWALFLKEVMHISKEVTLKWIPHIGFVWFGQPGQ